MLFIDRHPRLARIIGLLSVAVALSACSAIKLGYNTLPQVGAWWLDTYLDFSDEQEQRVRDDLARLHQWHRRQELPKLAGLLQEVEGMAAGPTTADSACALVPAIRLRMVSAAEFAEPAAVTLALNLGPQQLDHLKRKFDRNNADYRKNWVELPAAELREKRFRQYLDRMETIYGSLDDAQQEMMRSQVAHTVFDPQLNLLERQRRQQDILQTLARLAGQPVSLADARNAIHALTERAVQSPDARYRAYQNALIQEGCANLAAVHNSTTPQQRQNAVQRLRAYQRDLQELAAQP